MKNIYNILKPKDIAKLNAPTFYKDDTQTFTFLMKLILFTRKYPNLHSVIKVYIVQHPEEINKVIGCGYTPLHIAIDNFDYTNIKTVKLLLKYKASTIIEDELNATPLISAIF